MGQRAAWAVSWAALVALAVGCASAPRPGGTPLADVPSVTVPSPQRVAVSDLRFSADGDATRIRLAASGPVRHQLVSGGEPATVELDLFDVTFEGIPPQSQVQDGTVEAVSLRALPGGVGRVTVRLAAAGDARVEADEAGLDLVVRLRPVAAAPAAPKATAAPARGPTARLLPGNTGLAFEFGAEADNLSAFPLSDGMRLVVDAEGVDLPGSQVTEELAEGPVARVRIGRRQEGGVRAVLEARRAGAFDGHSVERRPGGFAVLWGAKPAAAATQAPAAPMPVQTLAMAQASPSDATLPGGGAVVDLGFRQEPARSLVEIGASVAASYEVTEATGERVVIDLKKTTLPDKFRRALDTSAFPGPVKLIAAYERGGDTRVVVDLRRPAPYQLLRDGAQLTLAFEGGSGDARPAQVSQNAATGRDVIVIEGQPSAGTSPEAAKAAEGKAMSAGPRYTGRHLSMDFVDADIRNVLRIIGEVSGLNVVAGDGVQGKVTVRLVDVPWDQALEVILKTRGLDQVREGTVVRIAPAEKLAQEKARALEVEKAAEQKAPLVTDIVPVNYATAQELVDKVKSILSERGAVSVDQRTNAILVKDVVEKVAEARELVARLDTQTPQVMIEARIVEVGSAFARDLGIQWGGRFNADTAHGNATGWAFPHSVGVQGGTGTQDFAVNFPAAVAAGGPGGALAMTLGHINDVLTLDLRLSAIETSGKGRVLSSPRVTTLDNKTAEISQGIEIPFTTATEEKIETQSIEYKLKLNVTPHVTADKSIIMKIDVTKDAPSSIFFATDGTPAIETRAANTEVLVKDGETTVIGGIITDTQSESESSVPFLGRIPYLGALFRQRDKRTDKTELIIFITPKIANVHALARNP